MNKKIKVLIVDDSAVVRKTLSDILSSDPQIEVIATASDPFIAAKKMRLNVPDVITLDVDMPRMDGLTFLQKIMNQHPIPVIMCSSLTEKNCEITLKALEYGAVEIIQKPKLGTKQFFEESMVHICDVVKAASLAGKRQLTDINPVEPKYSADKIIRKSNNESIIEKTEKIVIIGASTGGTEALRIFLEAMPLNAPGIVVVQHMPEKFTAAFSNRLDGICKISVKEAENGDSIISGRALIAPGNHHLLIKRNGLRYYVEVREGPLVCRHRPSVDVLFRSAAKYAGKNAIGIIMTGMGDDGARGMLEMKEAGAFNIAQDEASSVVFGMPNEAIKRGCVDRVLSLENISREVIRICKS